MNKMIKFALTAVLGAGLIVPALAQDNFPDVPDNHWAFEALSNLKGSVLFGYPDGLYRGNRPTTRYEFAVALNQLYMRMMGVVEGMEGKISDLERMIGQNQGGDNSDLRTALEALKRDVDGMKAWRSDIENFKRLSTEFEKELASLGVDVDKLQSDVASLDERVRRLENGGASVKIGGDVNFLILGGHSNDGDFGLTQDGRPTGVGNLVNPVGVTRDLSVLHELGLNISGKVDDNTSFKGTVVFGDTLAALGSLNTRNAGVPFNNGGNASDVYIYNLSANFNSALAGQGFNAEVGRVGHQVGKYLWKRSDYTPYYANERWDNGNFIFDGAILGFNFGEAKVNLFGGKNSQRNTTNGTDLNMIGLNLGNPAAVVDTTLGLQAMFGLGDNGKLNLAYIIHDSDVNPTTNGGVNRLSVYGAEADFNFSGLAVSGKYSQSVAGRGDTSVIDNDNSAFEVGLGYKVSNFDLMGGYRRVETNFLAAGSWDRIGTVWSPRNIEGFFAGVNFKPSSDLSVYVKGQFMEPVQAGAAGNPLVSANDDVTAFKVGLDYKLASNWGFKASYEDVRWNYAAGTDPNQRWFHVGFDYGLGANSNVAIGYLYSDVDFKGRQAAFGFGNNRYRGGLITTQLSVKF